MKETELVEILKKNTALTNLFFLADEMRPMNCKAIADAFYCGEMTAAQAVEELSELVFS